MRLFLVSHPVIFAAESMAAKGALEFPIASVDDIVALQVLARREPLVALPALESLLTMMTLRSRHTPGTVGPLDLDFGQDRRRGVF